MSDSWEYGEAVGEGARFPWPPAEDGSVLGAFGETWKSATFDAGSFFARMPKRGGTGAALLYYLVIGILVAGAGLFWDVSAGINAVLGQESAGAMGTVDPVVGFLLSPVVLLLVIAVSAGFAHVLLLVLGGARHGYATTVRVFAFAYSPMIFGVIPFLGSIVGGIWMLVLAVVGLREAHEADGWKAALAVLLPFAVLMGLFLLAALMLMAAGAALLAA